MTAPPRPCLRRLQYSTINSFASWRQKLLMLESGHEGQAVFHENKCIRYSCIEQEGVDVFVKLPALCSAAIVATKLVSSIHSPHELVADDTRGTGDRNLRSVLQSSEDSSHTSWLTVRRHGHHHLPVHPCASLSGLFQNPP